MVNQIKSEKKNIEFIGEDVKTKEEMMEELYTENAAVLKQLDQRLLVVKEVKQALDQALECNLELEREYELQMKDKNKALESLQELTEEQSKLQENA